MKKFYLIICSVLVNLALLSCKKEVPMESLLDFTELRDLYFLVKGEYEEDSVPPTPIQLIELSDNLDYSEIPSSPQAKNFVGYIYFYDGTFNDQSTQPLIYSRFKNHENTYRLIRMNGKADAVKSLPKIEGKLYLLLKDEKKSL